MVNYFKDKIEEKEWKNAEAKVVDAMVCYSYPHELKYQRNLFEADNKGRRQVYLIIILLM